MELSGFKIANDNIALESDMGYLDLHNCYDFRKIEYLVEGRSILLHWQKVDANRVPDNKPQAISVRIDGIRLFKVRERDTEIPFTEDQSLSSIGFIWDDMVDEMSGYTSNTTKEDCTHLNLEFESGLAIKIAGDTATLEVSPH